MKIIENKIVFSNDIKKILNGNNPLQFRYFKSEVPSSVLTTIDELRSDFKQDTNNIFARVILRMIITALLNIAIKIRLICLQITQTPIRQLMLRL